MLKHKKDNFLDSTRDVLNLGGDLYGKVLVVSSILIFQIIMNHNLSFICLQLRGTGMILMSN